MRREPSGLARWGRACLPLALFLAVGHPGALAAQGALSAQGFGYPTGGLSARALGTAGATGEFDLLSARNPAAVGDIGSAIVSVQGEPEVRTVRIGEVSERSRLQRVPLVAAGLRVRGVAILASGSTLLDRSFASRSTGSAVIDGMPVQTIDELEARGAMTEMRLAAGWSWKSLRLGAAAVAVTGDNTVVRARTFADSLRFGAVRDTASVGFQGLGASFGMNWRPTDGLLLGASVRVGGGLEAVRRDTAIAKANVPGRVGVGVLYDGLAGTILAASVERVSWSAMNGLGSEAATAQDATNWSLGAEFVGGSIRRFPVFWRVGYARRDLPFLLQNAPVSERALHAGLGIPLAGEGAVIDLALQRSQRRVTGNAASEDAWSLTAGLTVRP
jgi:hypothetical protein